MWTANVDSLATPRKNSRPLPSVLSRKKKHSFLSSRPLAALSFFVYIFFQKTRFDSPKKKKERVLARLELRGWKKKRQKIVVGGVGTKNPHSLSLFSLFSLSLFLSLRGGAEQQTRGGSILLSLALYQSLFSSLQSLSILSLSLSLCLSPSILLLTAAAAAASTFSTAAACAPEASVPASPSASARAPNPPSPATAAPTRAAPAPCPPPPSSPAAPGSGSASSSRS